MCDKNKRKKRKKREKVVGQVKAEPYEIWLGLDPIKLISLD
jgi:hypothetical protein